MCVRMCVVLGREQGAESTWPGLKCVLDEG